MSSSESEAFESADEDYEVGEKTATTVKAAEKEKQVESSDPKNKTSNKIDNNDVNTEKQIPAQSALTLDPQVESTAGQSSGSKKKDPSITQRPSKNKKEKPTKTALPPATKIQPTTEKPFASKKEKTPEPKIENKDIDDGWDLDDWGTNEIVDEQQTKPKDKVQETIKTKPKEKCEIQKDDDIDGWGDFEDWGESSETSKDQQDKHLKSVFPVLDEISPSKEHSKNDGIFQNFTKYVGKPQQQQQQQQPSATYDTFPVLDQISSRRKQTSPPKDEPEHFENKITSEGEQKTSSWGWKPWGGVVSLLSTATEGVTTLTSHVSHGLSTVIENSIGVPDPEEMARIQKQNEKKMKEFGGQDDEMVGETKDNLKESPKEDTIRNSFGTIVSGVTQIGNKVITGGLDTLEGIGKKTMTILQENDPLLLNKRKFLGLDADKPVLSQMLREAKEKSEETEKNLKQMQKHMYRKQLHFETLFDHYHGLVHLEALEMLSKQSSIKLQTLLEPLAGKALSELEETLNEVKELCDLGDIENDESDGMYTIDVLNEKFSTAIEDLGVEVDLKDILKCWTINTNWLDENPKPEAQEVSDRALKCLAETCALAVNKMHKIAELILIKDHHSTANEADSLVQLTTTFCWHLSGIANRFGGKLNSFETSEENSSLITSIFLEVSNSTSYIQSAFQLFIPILQIGAA